MQARIHKALEGDDGFRIGPELGQVIWAPGAHAYVVVTNEQSVRGILEPLLRRPHKLRSGGTEEGRCVTRVEVVKPGDLKFLHAVRENLLEHGLWLEVGQEPPSPK